MSCKAFAVKNDIQIVGTYIDRAFSARTDNRPDFQKMIKDSASKKFELIIVWKLDRFARDRYDSAHYKAALRKNGVKVISATEKISEGSEGILMEAVLEGMAEYYSAELSEKVVRGLTENAYKCKFNGGTLPLGYTIDSEQHFQIDPLVAPAVLEAFKRYAEGTSMTEIAQEMNAKAKKIRFCRCSENSIQIFKEVLIIFSMPFSKVSLLRLPSNDLKIWKSKRTTYPFKSLKRKCQSRCLQKTKFSFGFTVSANTILDV